MTIQDQWDRTGPVVDRLNAAIRENPLAAGLIGAGIAWMLLGGPKGLGGVVGAVKSTAGSAGAAASAAGSAVASGLSQASSAVAKGMTDAASSAAETAASIVPDMHLPETDKVSEATSNIRAAVGSGFDAAASAGREYGAVIQSKLSESLERQPLLLGALGLAIGAGIASTFASTSVEGEWMGAQATAAQETLQGFADDVKGRATQVVSDIKDEAAHQGLTAADVKGAAAGIGEKVKAVAGAGQQSVSQRFSGS